MYFPTFIHREDCLHSALLLDGMRNTLPLFIIRYNPHGFKVDGKTCPTPKVKREEKLLQLLKMHRPEQNMEVMYMFYSGSRNPDGHLLDIWTDPDYNESFKSLCCTPIFTTNL